MTGLRSHRGPLLGIGVGVPGAVDPGEESLVTAPALSWEEVALKEEFETHFDLPVIVDNKALARRWMPLRLSCTSRHPAHSGKR